MDAVLKTLADNESRYLPKLAEVVGMGSTVPIVTIFRDVLGVDMVFLSFSTADENIHAPNEFYRPARFRLGLQAWAGVWRRLSQQQPGTKTESAG